jgi:flagellar biogenesis protein FliO
VDIKFACNANRREEK